MTTPFKGPKIIIAESECMLNKQRREKPLVKQGGGERKAGGQAALRGRCRYLQRRSQLHPPVRLPDPDPARKSRPAARGSDRSGARRLRRLRPLRRNGPCGRALSQLLPGRHGVQSHPWDRARQRLRDARDRFFAAAWPSGAGPRLHSDMPERSGPPDFNIAIMALGGQGGGVMAEWTVRTGELAGYRAQYTSIQGVAQRTGATIYYIELFPEAEIERRGKEPVLALMPVPGDVDVVVASELMEAGRAIMRGFVTPDRTTLIGSSHRVLPLRKRSTWPTAARIGAAVLEAAEASAKALDRLRYGSDSARGRQRDQRGDVRRFGRFGRAAHPAPGVRAGDPQERCGSRCQSANIRSGLRPRTGRAPCRRLSRAGAPGCRSSATRTHTPACWRGSKPGCLSLPMNSRLRACGGCIDYQDLAYGALYLDRLNDMARWDEAAGGAAHRHELVRQAARHLALWMTFEDTFRVADLKTRGSRFSPVPRRNRGRKRIRSSPSANSCIRALRKWPIRCLPGSAHAVGRLALAGPLFARGRQSANQQPARLPAAEPIAQGATLAALDTALQARGGGDWGLAGAGRSSCRERLSGRSRDRPMPETGPRLWRNPRTRQAQLHPPHGSARCSWRQSDMRQRMRDLRKSAASR